jgi:hypothetical protein
MLNIVQELVIIGMKTNLIIVDDFYNDPNHIRNFALAQDFSVKGNYPGIRTKPFLFQDVKDTISRTVYQAAGNVTDWLNASDDVGYTGAFQMCTSIDRTWIHSDYNNMWAGVCYLNPDAPLSGGTALYRHKPTGERESVGNSDHGEHGYDYTKWEVVDRIGNVYNRLILYRGNLFHASVDYFGNNFGDGRLFQVFFFNTEY